jgi:hypothetical protein
MDIARAVLQYNGAGDMLAKTSHRVLGVQSLEGDPDGVVASGCRL